jgi:hypothetical protein
MQNFIISCEKGNKEIVELLLKSKTRDWSPFTKAAEPIIKVLPIKSDPEVILVVAIKL